MPYCIFCKGSIPLSRKRKNVKYCSASCIKKAFYVRNLDIRNQTSQYISSSKKQWDETETGKGRKWEEFIAKKFGGVLQPFCHPFDILQNNQKIDVKSCNLYKRKIRRGKAIKDVDGQTGWWVFNRGKTKPIDFFICVGLEKGVLKKIYKIPNDAFLNGITISIHKSKYDKFLIS